MLCFFFFFFPFLKLNTFKDASRTAPVLPVWAFHGEIQDEILTRKTKPFLEPLRTGRAVSPASSNSVLTGERQSPAAGLSETSLAGHSLPCSSAPSRRGEELPQPGASRCSPCRC